MFRESWGKKPLDSWGMPWAMNGTADAIWVGMKTPEPIDLTPYRWWVIAKTEEEARIIIRRTRERNGALGLPVDHHLTLI